jgi:hypothetical protein
MEKKHLDFRRPPPNDDRDPGKLLAHRPAVQPLDGSTWNIDRETYVLFTRRIRSTRISLGPWIALGPTG